MTGAVFEEFLFDGPAESPNKVILAHGSGAGMDSPFLERFACSLGQRGIRVARFEFPYMQLRRSDGKKRFPDRSDVLRTSWVQAVEALGPGWVLGGKSLGGRIASMIADQVGARGLLCLGYPFHPPGRPATLRVGHLQSLKTPTLILQGTRDVFGLPEEVATYALSPAIRIHWIAGGDHGFEAPRATTRNLLEVVEQSVEFLRTV